MRRKRRRNTSGANKKGMWFRWSEKLTVRVGSRLGNQRPIHLAMKADHGAEKSLLTKRRRRGLRKGKRRSRGCQPREPPQPATAVKPPNLRLVTHRRRPMAWLMKVTYTFSQKCTVYVGSKDWPCYCTKTFDALRCVTSKTFSCKSCRTRKKMKEYLLVKWTRLHNRANELGFPHSIAFDSTFFRYLRREFGTDGVVYERSILRGSFPFRWIDPIGESGEELIMPSGTENVVRNQTLPRLRRRGGGPRLAPGQKLCRMCGGFFIPGTHPSPCKSLTPQSKKGGRPLRKR